MVSPFLWFNAFRICGTSSSMITLNFRGLRRCSRPRSRELRMGHRTHARVLALRVSFVLGSGQPVDANQGQCVHLDGPLQRFSRSNLVRDSSGIPGCPESRGVEDFDALPVRFLRNDGDRNSRSCVMLLRNPIGSSLRRRER